MENLIIVVGDETVEIGMIDFHISIALLRRRRFSWDDFRSRVVSVVFDLDRTQTIQRAREALVAKMVAEGVARVSS